MMYKNVGRRFYFSPGVTGFFEVPVPDLSADPTQAKAMGQSLSEKEERIDEFITNVLFPQYTGALKRVILTYQQSKLPDKYLHGHTVKVIPMPIMIESPACYSPDLDLLVIDADTLSIGRRILPGKFVYGHEFGHRIMHFCHSQAVANALSEVASILSISDAHLQTEVLADAFGSLLSDEKSRFNLMFEPSEQEGLQRIALKLAWSC